jgi:hypothetical protein
MYPITRRTLTVAVGPFRDPGELNAGAHMTWPIAFTITALTAAALACFVMYRRRKPKVLYIWQPMEVPPEFRRDRQMLLVIEDYT